MAFDGLDELSRTIVERLTREGWEQTTRSRESGVAESVHNNGDMRMSIFQSIEDRSLALTLVDIESGGSLRFDVEYGDSIARLLDILTAWQDRLSVDNFRDMMNEIASSFPETYAEPFEGDEDTPWEKVIPRP
jgi:hypothetical protein